MSKRLQVIVSDAEYGMIRNMAKQQNISIAEWVRRALYRERQARPHIDANKKLGAVRAAINYNFPTADIDQMLGEIESGYGTE